MHISPITSSKISTARDRVKSSLVYEIAVSWRFVSQDLPGSIVPALLFLIAAWRNQAASLDDLLRGVLYGAILFFLYAYTFCVSNQMVGVEEDRLNNPERPLAAGLISDRGARQRLLISMALYTFCGWQFGVLEWVFLWQLVTLLYNFGGWSRHWFTKNLSMALGSLAQLACAWQLIGPITGDARRWVILLSFVVFAIIAVQDLRDIEGDRESGRRTLPLVWGEKMTRTLLTIGFSALPVLLADWLLLAGGWTLAVVLCSIGLATLSWMIAARISLYRTPQADHRTYMLFTVIYCAILGSVAIVL
jgi:4-hydroxybenzoate polyprenyltransferase